MTSAWAIASSVLASGVAASGFAVIFDVDRRILGHAALAGAGGQLVKQLAAAGGVPAEIATFLGAVAVALLAELLERRLGFEAPLFSVPGFIPLVPGVPAFHAVVSFAAGDSSSGVAEAARAFLLTCAIGAGLGCVKAVARIRRMAVG